MEKDRNSSNDALASGAEPSSMATGEEERNAITMVWRIENLSYWQPGFHDEGIFSPYFCSRNLGEKGYQLVFYPRSKTEVDIDVCLNLFAGNAPVFPLDCEFSLMTCDGSPLVTRTVRNRVVQWPDPLHMPDCPKHEEVFSTKKSAFLPHDTLTVRCRIWKSSGNFPFTEFCSTHTRIEVAKDCFLWPIEEFNRMNLKESVTFPVRLRFIHGLVDFQLKCSLLGHSLQNSGLYIEVTANKIHETLLAKLKVSILSNRQEVLRLKEYEHSFPVSQQKQTWGLPKFVSRKRLLDKNSPLMCDEVLKLVCDFTAVAENFSRFVDWKFVGTLQLEQAILPCFPSFSEMNCHTPQVSSDAQDCHLQQKRQPVDASLVDDLQFLYEEQTLSDFSLRTGDVSFPVHKVILSARSPVFKAMFSSNMKESGSKSLEVPDLDAHTLNRMLTFLYTGSMEPPLHLEGTAKLYYAADKYQVESLREQCSSLLKSVISVSNVSDILVLADRHQDQELTTFVHNFILSSFEEVMDSDEWINFLETHPYLAGKSTHLLCRKRKKQANSE